MTKRYWSSQAVIQVKTTIDLLNIIALREYYSHKCSCFSLNSSYPNFNQPRDGLGNHDKKKISTKPCIYLATQLRLKQMWELSMIEHNVNNMSPEEII